MCVCATAVVAHAKRATVDDGRAAVYQVCAFRDCGPYQPCMAEVSLA